MLLRSRIFLALIALLITVPLLAQQTGTVSGRVTATDGSALPGVTVEARSTVLPSARVTTTDGAGNYRLPALVPGRYTLTYSLAGMQTLTRKAEVQLSETTTTDVKLTVAGVSEIITVTAASTLVDKTSTELSSGVSSEQIQALPVGTDYRDLVKLSPGVQQTPDTTRGPSAGGSGQDNVYQIDGVNVTMPLYGTLSAEPAAYDIAQVTITKGGAKAIDFNRAAGFLIDTVSKSGTNKLSGQLAFRLQSHSMTSKQKVGTAATYDQDRSWANLNLGGPILQDRLFFYGSYYRPEVTRTSQSNVYGALPKYGDTRNEEFGKLTFTPSQSWLVNGSYRTSKHEVRHSGFGSYGAVTTGAGYDTEQHIGTLEASWITSPKSFATAKFNDFALKTAGLPDYPLSAITPTTALGTKLDINNLDQLGGLFIPTPISGNTTFNNFIQPYIDKYGFLSNGTKVGGGAVGVYSTLQDRDDFFRKSAQVGYNWNIGSNVTHDLHAGYQRYTDTEELQRLSNGWGDISLIGGRSNCPSNVASCKGQPIFYQALFYQATLGSTPVRKIHAEYRVQNLEFNDTINMANWSFNLGLVASNDTLYGQGLKSDSSTLSGYVLSPGSQYKMYDIPWKKMIQPRLGATWSYNGEDTLYVSAARYNPAGNSLPRAASWDRNYTIRQIRAYFDQSGSLIGVQPLASSSGKLFQKNLDPRQTKEFIVGTSQQVTNRLSGRLYGRYRKSDHFWEDTNNTARIDYKAPAPIPNTPYIPDLSDKIAQIGSGSSYVIAELDGAFTKYYEATAESEWRGDKTFIKGSYTWSHYYGNFDQDNTTGAGGNDANIYIGSSNVGDGPGRQLWENKYGNLTGDRRHLLKIYGAYYLPWNASAGAYVLYQSGAPWTAWDYTKYAQFPDNTTNETIKFAEPAGHRKTPSHTQLDLNYTQNIPVHALNLQVVGEVFNVLNSQSGYNPDPRVHNATTFGTYLSHWAPRRIQLSGRVQF